MTAQSPIVIISDGESGNSESDNDSDSEIEGLFEKGYSQSKSPIKSESRKLLSVKKKIHYLNGRRDVPIYSFQKRRPTTTEAVGIILDPELDHERVCTSQPTCISKDSVFIVDLKQLKHPSDVLCDDMGTWACNGCRRMWITVDEDGELEFFNKNKPQDCENCYKVVRKYYNHKGSTDFHRMALFLEDGDEDLLDLALLHYCFDNEEHPVLTRPHGNAKSDTGFVRTMPSTLSKVRELSETQRPKYVVSKLSQSVGGILGASSTSQLPRNRQQSADCRRQLFSSKVPATHSKDPLFPLMLMCKESEGSKTDSHTRFVRIVTNSPQPMAVLVYDWTLRDMERFCADPRSVTILSIDPTFNLGSFHVTVTTYRHPMLSTRHGSNPVMLGALFIHQCKTFATYNFFFSQLVGLCPELKNIRCFGTDGEKALVNALHTQFKSAIHLRCFLHFRGNLEDKLASLGISKPNAQEFIKDILGNPALLENGLVDAEVTELDKDFDDLQVVWDEREASLSNSDTVSPSFHRWFKRNCLEEVRNCMLKDKREQAGLGSPPEPFYTNDVESKNRVLKLQAEYKPQELPVFVQSMKDLLAEQKREIEKAMIGVGEYKLLPTYSNLEVPHSQWFKKNEKQRHRLLARFMNAAVRGGGNADLANLPVPADPSPECPTQDDTSTSNLLKCIDLPEGIQASMWNKVQTYLEDESSYTKSPGVLDYSCVVVKSTSGNKPHVVERTGFGRYKCDKECLMFKSTNGLCSHSLLVATLNGEVDTFIRSHSKTKNPVNYAQLAQHGLPAGGKKPGSKRKASAKSTTAKIKKALADTDVRTKRGQSSKTPDTGAASPPVPSVCSVGITAPYANSAGATVSPVLSMQTGPDNTSQQAAHMQSNQTKISSLQIAPQMCADSYFHTSTPSTHAQVPITPWMQAQVPVSVQVPVNVQTPHFPMNTQTWMQSPPMNAQTQHQVPMTPMQTQVTQQTPSMRPLPPPLLHQSPESSVGQRFRVVLTNARISRCQGCRGQIDHKRDQIVLQHKEHVLFQNPHTGRWQMSRDLRNTYYHAQLNCVATKHPDFSPSELEAGEVKDSLSPAALSVLRQEFGLLL